MTTLAEFRTKAFNVSQLRIDDGSFSTADMNELINTALQELATYQDWPWLYAEETITTVDGQRDYPVPTGWTRTSWMQQDRYRPMQVRQLREIETFNFTTAPKSSVLSFYGTVGDTSIRVAPTPDSVFTVRHGYHRSEPALVNDADVPLLDDAYTPYLVWKTVALMGHRKGDDKMIRRAENQVDRWQKNLDDNRLRTLQAPRILTRNDW